MPEPPNQQPMPLLAPIQMLSEGLGTMFASSQSVMQSFLNMGAQNLQDVNQTIQRGQAQFITGMNQGIQMMDGLAKKPLVDIQSIGQGGAPQPAQNQQPASPGQQTTFSPPPAGGSDQAVRQSAAEQFYPLTMNQSDFTQGGFTNSPRNTDQPAQAKSIKTQFM